jgi:phospholipase C
MARSKVLLFWGLLVCTATLLSSLGGCGGGSSANSTPPPTQKIQHVVVIFQENRTPDNLFQDQVLINRGADIQTFGFDSTGTKIPLAPQHLANDYDLGHSHGSFLAMYDNGKMDGADRVSVTCNPNAPPTCPPPNPWFQYIYQSDVAPYFELAETYTFGDRMFQTNEGPSFPAHQFIISGTSAPTTGTNTFVSENPINGPDPFHNAGCISPPEERVKVIAANGSENQQIYPCFEHPTLTDMLNSASISWRYYSPSAGIIWNAPNAIQHMCVPNVPPPNGTACTGADWVNNVVLQSPQVLTDIQNGNLATVTWVIPPGQSSDHAGGNDGSGPAWVASVVNAIGNSQYWSNTAIFITWDDWGGWYDHVAPKVINDGVSWGSGYAYGFRVPLIVVSPYAKAQYISHTTHDFGSILKYIEENFGLGSMGNADANADDLSDCFDYSQTPLTFKTIPAAKEAKYFLEDKTPPTDPDND